jgi:16S rRNA (uracil1498-N3)-methyltransferase
LGQPFAFDAPFAARLRRRQLNPKEAFTLHDVEGAWFRATIRTLEPAGGTALPYERLARSPEPTVEITLACAVLARQRMIFVMQKATELGVARVIPLFSAFSVPRAGLDHEKAHAWPGQVLRGARQCRRSSLPEVLPPTPLDAFLASAVVAGADLTLYLDDRADAPPRSVARPARLVLIAGPEGGFSDAERGALRNRAHPWLLGGRVLRAETAVLAGLTAAHVNWGDFRCL